MMPIEFSADAGEGRRLPRLQTSSRRSPGRGQAKASPPPGAAGAARSGGGTSTAAARRSRAGQSSGRRSRTASARRPRRCATPRARPSARGRRGPRISVRNRRQVAHSRRDQHFAGTAADMMRDAIDSDAADLGAICSTSPTWTPARTSSPSSWTCSTISSAHRTAAAGASKITKKPSPAVSISRPASAQRGPDRGVVELDELAPACRRAPRRARSSRRCRSSRPWSDSVREPRPARQAASVHGASDPPAPVSQSRSWAV